MISIRAVLAAATLAMLPVASGAQEIIPGRTWGPVIGFNRTTMGGAAGDSVGYKSKGGLLVGLQAQRELRNPNRFIRSGAYVSRRGGYQSDTAGNQIWLNMTYLEVPLLVGANILKGNRAKVHVLGGVLGGYRMGCSFRFNSGGTKFKVACKDNPVNFNTSTFEFAGVAGGGLTIPRPNGVMTLGATYAWGFASVDKSATPGDYKHRGASFTIGYLVPMKRR